MIVPLAVLYSEASLFVTFSFRKLFSSYRRSSEKAETLPDSIDVRVVDGVTVVTYLKQPSVEDTKQVVRYLAGRRIYSRRIWDTSRIDFPYSLDELRDIAYYGRKKLGDHNRLAVVVKDSVGYGSTRAFSVYRDGDDVATSRVFKSLDEAMKWVKAGD